MKNMPEHEVEKQFDPQALVEVPDVELAAKMAASRREQSELVKAVLGTDEGQAKMPEYQPRPHVEL